MSDTDPKKSEDGIKRFKSLKEYIKYVKSELDDAHEDSLKVITPSTES